VKALIVSGSPRLRTAWRDMARLAGVDGVDAGTHEEAVAVRRRTGPIDVALVDWDADPFAAARLVVRLRREDPVSPLCVWVVTSGLDAISLIQAFASGADDLLVTPFSAQALARKLHGADLVRSDCA